MATLQMSTQPSPTASSRDHSWKSPTGSNLYLATFLTTLCLLLFGSCAIVIRSIVIRRRLRRRLRGSFMADGMGAVHRPRHRKRRPKFHDHWIAPAVAPSWQHVMPLSLHFVLGKRSAKSEALNAEAKTETKRFGLKTWSRSTSSHPSTIPPDSDNPTTNHTKLEIAQVSVLIEMPSLVHSARYGAPKSCLDDDEPDHEALPELLIGYARCHKHPSVDFATSEEKDRL